MNVIHLHGSLKREFGGPFRLAVHTPAEAVVALSRMKPGFEDQLRAGSWRVVRGARGKGKGRDLTVKELGVTLPGEMHLIPAPAGGKKKGGIGKIIVGVMLVAVAVALAFTPLGPALGFAAPAGATATAGASLGFGATASLGLGLSVTAGQIGFMGLAMVFGGVSQMLAPTPKAQQPQDPRASYLFSGQLNSAEQGVAVPLALGEGMVGGVIISLTVETADISNTSAGSGPGSGSSGSVWDAFLGGDGGE